MIDRLMQLAVKSRSSGSDEDARPVWQKVKQIEEKKRKDKEDAESDAGAGTRFKTEVSDRAADLSTLPKDWRHDENAMVEKKKARTNK